MNGTAKSVFLLSVVAFASLSVHACMLDELPSGGATAGGAGAGSAGEGSDSAGAAGEGSGGAGAAGAPSSAGAAAEGGAGGAGQGSGGTAPRGGEGGAGGEGMPDPPQPCDTPVCQPGAVDRETLPCGECSDTITRTRSCRADTCTWGEWGAWSACAAECKPDHWRCCGTGKWEWCYKNTCRWTDDCETCPSGSCNCS